MAVLADIFNDFVDVDFSTVDSVVFALVALAAVAVEIAREKRKRASRPFVPLPEERADRPAPPAG